MLKRLLSDLFHPMPRKPGAPQPDAARRETSNPLEKYFYANKGRLIHKWVHYFEIYDRYFAPFRGRAPVVVEIGVSQGGSLQMWHDYFGPGTRIVGIDIDPRCKRFEDESTTIMIGSQSDRNFLAEVRRKVPHIDILIDDGGHRMDEQIITFEELYPHIQPRGVYLCEDIHTSFSGDWGGGYRREGTFHEYSKALTDHLYAWYSQEPERFAVGPMTLSTYAMHFYDSVFVVEKRPMTKPVVLMTGTPSF